MLAIIPEGAGATDLSRDRIVIPGGRSAEFVIMLDGTGLDAPTVAAVATRRAAVALAPAALARAGASFEYAQRVAAERPVYGRSTGVGGNRDVPVADPEAHAVGLLRSHASSLGTVRGAERVRGMLVVRLNQLAAGGSGVHPDVLTGLEAMLNNDALPPVRELGSLGTGDLPALAVTALALSGELPTSSPLPVRVRFGPGDALPFLSSNAAAIADAMLAHDALARLARATTRVAALTFRAVDGNPEAFGSPVEGSTHFAGIQQVCLEMRQLIGQPRPPARIQDPYGLRVLPQVHGAFLDRLESLHLSAIAMANAPRENPALLPDAGVFHHGSFFAATLGQVLDATVSAAAQTAQLGLGRLTVLSEPGMTGLPPFLGDGTPGASGLMVVEYVAASALARLRVLAGVTGTQTVTLSRGFEEGASFASLAARQALDSVEPLRAVLACELVAAVRALRMRGMPVPVGVARLPDEIADRDLTADLELACDLLDELDTAEV
jgi:histidine ammonia-lyase